MKAVAQLFMTVTISSTALTAASLGPCDLSANACKSEPKTSCWVDKRMYGSTGKNWPPATMAEINSAAPCLAPSFFFSAKPPRMVSGRDKVATAAGPPSLIDLTTASWAVVRAAASALKMADVSNCPAVGIFSAPRGSFSSEPSLD